MSIDLNARVTTDVVHSSNQSRAVVAPPSTKAPTVQLIGSERQTEAASGNQILPAIVNEEPTAELDRTVITVYDIESEEVIRQIPSEEFLELVRHFNEAGKASLINEKA